MKFFISRRTLLVLIYGIAEIAYGFSVFIDPARQRIGYEWLVQHGGLKTWSLIWIIGGALAIMFQTFPWTRKWLSFVLLYPGPTIWGLTQFYSWIQFNSGHPLSNPHGWTSAVTWWSAWSLVILVVSGWEEVDHKRLNATQAKRDDAE